MNTRLSKLVSFYRDASGQGAVASSYPSKLESSCFYTQAVAQDYSPPTLRRLVFSRESEIRCAAVWALGQVGGASEYRFLGPLLRANDPRLRLESDRSREQLLLRTRTAWQIQYAQQIEDSMVEFQWNSANQMADRLVAKHADDPQSWLLRVSIRLCTSQWLGAIEDCLYLLSFDRDSYRACLFLGQCYWMTHRLRAAKECFREATRIYPDCFSGAYGIIHGYESPSE